jgi:hypothetical protein
MTAAAFLLAASAAAAQDPDTSPPPPGRPEQAAVPRAPDSQPAAQERRGSVRAPERAVERPVRVDQPASVSPPRTSATTAGAAVPRSASTASDEARGEDEQRGQRRGSVRQPPNDNDGRLRTRDRAVARRAPPPPSRVVVRGYPYNYRSYSRYYDPWGYGSFGLGYFYYSPWAWGPYGYPGYYPRYGGTFGFDVGSLKIKVQPRDAEVWVDGYYAGTVDDFDGMFQALRLDSGPYRIEIRKPGFETLTFDVRVQPERTITFRGTMQPLP